jgi:hypothetical protein
MNRSLSLRVSQRENKIAMPNKVFTAGGVEQDCATEKLVGKG